MGRAGNCMSFIATNCKKCNKHIRSGTCWSRWKCLCSNVHWPLMHGHRCIHTKLGSMLHSCLCWRTVVYYCNTSIIESYCRWLNKLNFIAEIARCLSPDDNIVQFEEPYLCAWPQVYLKLHICLSRKSSVEHRDWVFENTRDDTRGDTAELDCDDCIGYLCPIKALSLNSDLETTNKGQWFTCHIWRTP